MTLRRVLTTATVMLFSSLLTGSFAAIADTGPAQFVRTLGNTALSVIRADMAPAQKQNFFHQLLQQDFDIPGMARFVLGPYWRVAREPEKQEFSRLFEDYIVRIYSQRFAQYHGEPLKETGSRSGPEGAIVTSEIVRPAGGPPIKVEWRLGTRDGLYRVDDVIIDGVSMGASERTEFALLIQRGGGQVQGLLAMMRDRAAASTRTRQAAPAPNPGTIPPPRRTSPQLRIDGLWRGGRADPSGTSVPADPPARANRAHNDFGHILNQPALREIELHWRTVLRFCTPIREPMKRPDH